jgi:hypothetical protein
MTLHERGSADVALLVLCAVSDYVLWRPLTQRIPRPAHETQHIINRLHAAPLGALV